MQYGCSLWFCCKMHHTGYHKHTLAANGTCYSLQVKLIVALSTAWCGASCAQPLQPHSVTTARPAAVMFLAYVQQQHWHCQRPNQSTRNNTDAGPHLAQAASCGDLVPSAAASTTWHGVTKTFKKLHEQQPSKASTTADAEQWSPINQQCQGSAAHMKP